MNVAMVFIDALEDIYNACGSIQDAGGCDACPIKHNCLDDTSVSEFANFCTKDSLNEFMGFAEDVENYASELEMANYHEWLKRE